MKNSSKLLNKIEKLARRASQAVSEDMNRIICTHDSDFPNIELQYQQLSIHREATLSPAIEKLDRLADAAASIRHSLDALRESTPVFHELQQCCNFFFEPCESDDEPPDQEPPDQDERPVIHIPMRHRADIYDTIDALEKSTNPSVAAAAGYIRQVFDSIPCDLDFLDFNPIDRDSKN
jgi:hypothetical protein